MLRGALEPWHVIIIVALLFVLFGAKRMPDASRSLARSMKIFKNEVKDLRDDDDDDTVTPEIAATPVVRAPVAGGATAVTPAPVVTAPVSTSAAADEVALREAELRLAEAKVNELRARAAARSEHERV
jgi:sec-independent protein translocase protein TatA